MHVAILIDGSNLLGALGRAELSYPALAPLISELRGADELSFARFYSAPPLAPEWQARWQQFADANRHIRELDFFLGYRSQRSGDEKVIDVALAVDLIYGCGHGHFDRVEVVGGDGDHTYAFKIAKTLAPLRVHLMPGQPYSMLARARIAYRQWSASDLIASGICEQRKFGSVPQRHAAPLGSPQLAGRLEGALARPIPCTESSPP